MPPKKQQDVSKKTVEKKKEKVIEDKTFGLKNKKGNKQQKFIKMVNVQVKGGPKKPDERQLKKDEKKKQADELSDLFRPVQKRVEKGADPKSVVCAFFKQGQCGKGDKCKFSHDLNMERKGAKRNIYADEETEETMENWDEAKLADVIDKKHGEANKKLQKATDIICKHFLEAVESSKYGWFWSCPVGEKCHYKHALPPGFVLKKDLKKGEKKEEVSIEELIERERAALGSDTVRVTLETFIAWKERKRKEKIAAAAKVKDKKKNDFKLGKSLGISGREMFEFNPDLIEGDDDEAETDFKREDLSDDEAGEESSDVVVKDIDLDMFANMATYNENACTERPPEVNPAEPMQDESSKLDQASALPTSGEAATNLAISAAVAATVNGDVLVDGDVPVDENLFDGEDLDEIEDELDTLDLED